MDGNRLTEDLASLKIDREGQDGRPRRNPLKLVIWLLIAVALLAAAYFVALPRLSSQFFKTEVEVIELAMVSPAQASVQVTSTGYVVAEATAKVGSKFAGRIVELPVIEGSVVKKGDLIARLDDRSAQSLIATARAKVQAARVRAQAARASLAETTQLIAREKLLVERGVSGKAAVEDLGLKALTLNAQARAADAEITSAEAEMQAIDVDLKDMVILAPIDGVVTERVAKLGEMIAPMAGGVLNVVEIVDMDSLVIEVDVSENKLSLVKIGSPCEATLDAFAGQRFRCSTWQIGHKVDRSKATVKVKVKFVDKAAGAIPDMAAKVNFVDKAIDDNAVKEPAKLIVPGSALAERGGAKVVFVVSDNKVKVTPIQLGAAFGDGFVVTKGVTNGDKVVANPPSDMQDGQSIKEKRS